MAQTGFTPIVTYNTATATTVPSAANLAQGELAVNVTDKKLYTKDSGGNVVLLASSGGDVTGPASSTNLAIPTFSGTGGKTLLNNSGVTISAGVITATGFSGPLNGSLGATTPSTAVVTSINKMAITAPATSSTLAVADGKTLTASNSLTLAGTDATTMTFPTTSATIARTDAAQTFTGVQTISSQPILSSLTASQAVFTDASKGLVSNAITGTGNVVMSASPTLVSPSIGTTTGGLVKIDGWQRTFTAATTSIFTLRFEAEAAAFVDIAIAGIITAVGGVAQITRYAINEINGAGATVTQISTNGTATISTTVATAAGFTTVTFLAAGHAVFAATYQINISINGVSALGASGGYDAIVYTRI